MRSVRVIPCLDVDAGRVVKGVRFVELRDAGDPVELAARYDAEGADELVFLDITASSDDRRHDGRRRRAAPPSRCSSRSPSAAGVRTVDDARRLLRAGADKVGVNTAAVDRSGPGAASCADEFGAQCVVVAIDARPSRRRAGWEVFTHGGRTPTGLDAVEWAERVRAPRRRRDPADVDGPRRHAGRVRPRAHPRRRRRRARAGHRQRGRGQPRAPGRGRRSIGGADAVLAASIFHFGEYTVAQAKAALEAAGVLVRPVG